MVNQWPISDQLVVNQWSISGKLVIHQWSISGQLVVIYRLDHRDSRAVSAGLGASGEGGHQQWSNGGQTVVKFGWGQSDGDGDCWVRGSSETVRVARGRRCVGLRSESGGGNGAMSGKTMVELWSNSRQMGLEARLMSGRIEFNSK